MTAGQVWRRSDGLLWAEVQTEAIEGSGWRLLVPLFDPVEAIEAPPLVIRVANWHARVHLVTTAPVEDLGDLETQLDGHDLEQLRDAIRQLIRD